MDSVISVLVRTGIGLASVLLLAIVVEKAFSARLDPREPPLLPSKLPVIGHLIGFLRYGSAYYMQLCRNNDLPIYTINMPNGKTYVAGSTQIVTVIQRNAKTLSFDPILTIVAERLGGITGRHLHILREIESGGDGAHRKLVHAMSPSLTGRGLDMMNTPMLKDLEGFLNELEGQHVAFDLWKWTRHVISISSTDAVYGPENPYRIDNDQYEANFWTYESNLTMLLVNVYPQYTARESYRQREWLAERMIDYYRRGAWKRGSLMVQNRCQTGLDNQVPIEAIARLEVPGGTGILSNTVPTAFWTLVNILSRQTLLAEVRQEVEKVFTVEKQPDADAGAGAKEVWTLDAAELRTKCPLLFSIYQETLRTRASFASPRYVLEDTVLEGRYLLKKGSILQIPSASLHNERSQWGDGAQDFDPYRFTQKSMVKRSPVAFRVFGGAPALCPGRHFATVEVLCFVGMVVTRYDLSPASASASTSATAVEPWILPPPNYGNMAASILPPLGDIAVKVSTRKGYEGRKWQYKVTSLSSEEESLFALASEGVENAQDSLTRAGVGLWK
ncbi:hypothetical protein A1O3_02496 [Capronia epimyces CBS 606.96]|uniref:Cytochrome P450 oxidoreductase n=1 Tax=Capronia epimyces CBS 606.96 TaxID=1182542 RepID=W9Z4L6_9EURO|nr:uncharacterized protein A1O3_02496 [Capronia epimyces CBS 606.96]EXJ89429.1 hypothetical protein A1O3_02496 [Capronia epimyces CBS 606.96]